MDTTEGERPAGDYLIAGRRLQYWRRCRQMSRKDLARLINADDKEIGRIEEGAENLFTPALLVKLTRLGVPVHHFFTVLPAILPQSAIEEVPVLSGMTFVKQGELNNYALYRKTPYFYTSHAPSPDHEWRVFEWPVHPFDPKITECTHIITRKLDEPAYDDLTGNAVLMVQKGTIKVGWCVDSRNNEISFEGMDLQMQEINEIITFSCINEAWVVGKVLTFD
ncbi:MAG: helix-turn-helix domain-containing protein [Cyclobacteriaceae bacterium]